MRQVNFSSLKKFKPLSPASLEKFPNPQPKAQLGQGRAGSFCPLSWWCLSKMQTTWGKMVEIWWVSSPAKASLATLGLHVASLHYSTQPVHVPRGGARINVSGLAKNFLFCWQVYFIAFLMLVSSIPIHRRNEKNKCLKTITEEFVFYNLLQPNQGPFPTVQS